MNCKRTNILVCAIQEITKDSSEYYDLLNDAEKREKFAREKFLMKKENEDVYIIRRKND